jgi:hypothetical protein
MTMNIIEESESDCLELSLEVASMFVSEQEGAPLDLSTAERLARHADRIAEKFGSHASDRLFLRMIDLARLNALEPFAPGQGDTVNGDSESCYGALLVARSLVPYLSDAAKKLALPALDALDRNIVTVAVAAADCTDGSTLGQLLLSAKVTRKIINALNPSEEFARRRNGSGGLE